MLSLAERLNAERYQRFVGRNQECDLFQSAIVTAQLPFYLLSVFGPGGVGKTTLLKRFAQLCQQAQIPAVYLDARDTEPTIDSFLTALRQVIPAAATTSPIEVLAAQSGRQVLLIDTCEVLSPLNNWLRETFLPQLSEETLVVLAGRYPLDSEWQSDPGWQSLIHALALRNLSPHESRDYLIRRSIPAAQHQAVLEFTHGHPLALSLIADVLAQRQDLQFQPEAALDVVKVLLERFVREVPSPLHRSALESCALVRLVSESLLATMLDVPDAYELFAWLRSLSFTESDPGGLFPHDLVREVLTADLRWRNPDRYAQLHDRARSYYVTRLGQTQPQEQHRVLFDYLFLHRDNAAIKPRFIWQESSDIVTCELQFADSETLRQMVVAHEGAESAQILQHWLLQQPQSFRVFRSSDRAIVGFVCLLALHQTTEADRRLDPATAAAWNYLQTHAPLRSGEGATLFRFWMAQETYQAVSPLQSLIFIHFIQHHRQTPCPAFTFFPCAEPDFWAAMFTYADLMRLPAADFRVGDRTYGMYGHDWRTVSPAVWQQLLAQREISASAQTAPMPTSDRLMVLSQPDFFNAVQEAWRQFNRLDVLQLNPLLQSRLVEERLARSAVKEPSVQASSAERVDCLKSLLQTAAEMLKTSPKEAKSYRALYHTYLNPTETQELAAERLDLPFSTYRRHLKAGTVRVAELLWQQEIGNTEMKGYTGISTDT